MVDTFQEYSPTELSVYEFLRAKNPDRDQETAISFYGRKMTYRQLFQQIDTLAAALTAWGIQKNDVVAGSLPGIPEGIFLIYAINKIGAVYCAYDCRAKKEEIQDMIRTFSPKLCITPNFQVKEFEGVTQCPVVYISPIHSLGVMEKFYSIPANFFTGRDFLCAKQDNIIPYSRFIRKAKDVQVGPAQKADGNVFGYFYTSGTTYGRKSIILTNENINAAAIIHTESNDGILPGNSMLNIMPLFTCYSVTLAVHLPLINGVRVTLIPLLDPKKMKQVLIKEKPNYIITVPAHWEYFIKEDYNGCDLSFMKKIIVGGDTMNPAYLETLRNIFNDHGGTDPFVMGYGLSETTSTAISAKITTIPTGSIGRALPYTKVVICDPETGAELPPMEKGEICVYGPTVCAGYVKEEEMTQRLLRTHADGQVWLHSGDCGYMDEEGNLFFCERYKRMYVRFDGTKISPYSIEQVLKTCPAVEDCMLVAVTDTDHTHGKCGKALVVVKEEYKANGLDVVTKFCRKNLDMHMQPKYIKIVEQLPRTKNGKLDYFAAAQD